MKILSGDILIEFRSTLLASKKHGGKQLGSESLRFCKENVCMSACLPVCLSACPTKWGIPSNLLPCHNLGHPFFWTNLSLVLGYNVVDPIVASFCWICNASSIKTQTTERYIHTSLHKQKIKQNQTFDSLP